MGAVLRLMLTKPSYDPSAEKMFLLSVFKIFKISDFHLEFEEKLIILKKLATGTFLGRWLICTLGGFTASCET